MKSNWKPPVYGCHLISYLGHKGKAGRFGSAEKPRTKETSMGTRRPVASKSCSQTFSFHSPSPCPEGT